MRRIYVGKYPHLEKPWVAVLAAWNEEEQVDEVQDAAMFKTHQELCIWAETQGFDMDAPPEYVDPEADLSEMKAAWN